MQIYKCWWSTTIIFQTYFQTVLTKSYSYCYKLFSGGISAVPSSSFAPFHFKIICRQSALLQSSSEGLVRRGWRAPSEIMIWGPIHSKCIDVSLCTFRLFGLPSLTKRKVLRRKENRREIISTQFLSFSWSGEVLLWQLSCPFAKILISYVTDTHS